MTLYEQDTKYILNTYKRIPLEFDYGDGGYLYTKDGKKYLDFFSGIAVNQFGHNDPELKKRMIDQINKYVHLSNYFISDPVVELAKLLVENSFASKVFFANTGTESNEGALKIAVKWGASINENKTEIISALNGFHGRTTGALALTGQPDKQKPFASILPKVKHFEYNSIDSIKKIINENTCAVFLEMIQGEGGIVDLDQDFLNELLELKAKYNFLIIADEIQAGFGRTTDLFAFEKYGFEPDMATIAKALGGGLPLGAILVSEKLENVLQPGEHGTTFGGNPVACAAGLYMMEKLTDKKFMAEVKINADYMMTKLQELKTKYPLIKKISGRGYMVGVEVGDAAMSIKDKAMDMGMLLNVTSGTVVRLIPRINVPKNEIDEFLTKFEEILKEF